MFELQDSGSESGSERPNKSLSEAAREYEEARAVKRKYEEVVVVTGEEDEVNILQVRKREGRTAGKSGRFPSLILKGGLPASICAPCSQINCKLFAYDKSKSSWVERGRGNLRLNDKDIGNGRRQSRVIMRATGSLRVVLNTKVSLTLVT